MAAYAGPQPRAAHLTDDITSRCLYGTVRGACKGCSDCGRYIIKTKENYTSKHQATKVSFISKHLKIIRSFDLFTSCTDKM